MMVLFGRDHVLGLPLGLLCVLWVLGSGGPAGVAVRFLDLIFCDQVGLPSAG